MIDRVLITELALGRHEEQKGRTVYAKETFAGSLVFQRSCAILTLRKAVSAVNGGTTGTMAARTNDGRAYEQLLYMYTVFRIGSSASDRSERAVDDAGYTYQ